MAENEMIVREYKGCLLIDKKLTEFTYQFDENEFDCKEGLTLFHALDLINTWNRKAAIQYNLTQTVFYHYYL